MDSHQLAIPLQLRLDNRVFTRRQRQTVLVVLEKLFFNLVGIGDVDGEESCASPGRVNHGCGVRWEGLLALLLHVLIYFLLVLEIKHA
mmetsp:Transcript_18523/g.28444  ORF Transcript_18523/g.28444 Transcript_18523/m.28444 type:complete len:88 (+) Transcript_18523:788-1051(+)